MTKLYFFLFFLSLPASLFAQCGTEPFSVVIDTAKRRLFLCEKDKEIAHYRVAIGRGGTGKQVQGDHKTPLGTYPLGKPRPSKKFGTFVPIEYPTPAQKKHGFTGSDVGIHGPVRWLSWFGWMFVRYDWTDGCVGTSSMGSIEEISDFVEKHHPMSVHIN